MGNEAIEGSKMGSQLIMFVAIVGLALIAFLVGKNLMNTGLEQMESTVQSVNDSRFSDYNGKTVRGRAVKSAIDTFANDNVAIFVHTLAMDQEISSLDIEKTHPTWSRSAHTNFTDTTSTPGSSQVWRFTYSEDTAGKQYGLTVDRNDGTTLNDGVIFVNYGAMLSTDGTFTFDGKINFDRDFALTGSGNVMTNGDGSNISKHGSAEYIANSANFNAQLIKNTAGETIGILFYQKKTF